MVSKGTTRCCVMTFNCLTMLIGAIILGAGIFVKIKGKETFDIITEAGKKAGVPEEYDINTLVPTGPIDTLVLVVIILGVFIFFVSFLGFCGAQRESRFVLLLYCIFMLLLAVIQLGMGAGLVILSGQVNSPDMEERIFQMYESVRTYLPAEFTKQFGMGQSGAKDLQDFIVANFNMVGAVCIVIFFVQVSAFICGCLTRSKIE